MTDFKDINRDLLSFIASCPTAFHTATRASERLAAAGFQKLDEREDWNLEAGKGYFVLRNGSAVIAFRLPEQIGRPRYQICASHGDSPCLKVKNLKAVPGPGGNRISAETYGGGLWGTWFDRPLSVAGRVMVRQEDGSLRVCLVDLGGAPLMLPNLPIHFNREANKGVAVDSHVDLLPLFSSEKDSLAEPVARALGVSPQQIVSSELSVYCRSEGFVWGADDEYISSPRLDDLQCAYATLRGFLAASGSESIGVWACLDNEEVGSMTKQGAAGTFLADVLARIGEALNLTPARQRAALAASLMLSADNAHAVHPNHAEIYDGQNRPVMNGGVVIKHAVAYSTDAVSDGLFRSLLTENNQPVQDFSNRSDIRGGSTLANIATGNLSIRMVDIGMAQLAMHSAFETAGAADTGHLADAAELFFSRTLTADGDIYRWK